MVANPYTGYTYDCSCTESDVYAYVYPDEHGTIYLCDVFWEVSTTGTDSQVAFSPALMSEIDELTLSTYE